MPGHLVSIPLPVPAGLLVDLVEVLDQHCQDLEVRSDGQVLTLGPAQAPIEPPEEPRAGAAPPPSSNESAPAVEPSSEPRPASKRPARPPERSDVLEDILTTAAAESGHSIEDICGKGRQPDLTAWRYAAISVACTRGASRAALSQRFDIGSSAMYGVLARLSGHPERYQFQIERIVTRLDGPVAPEPAPASPPDHPEGVAALRALVDGEHARQVPPPFPSVPPMTRRTFDPDAARAGAAAGL